MANGDAIFPWNRTVNEYWDPSTALFVTLGSGRLTYPEAKAVDVFWDLLVGRGGQALAGIMAFTVIRKSLLLSKEEKPVPLPLTFAVYFDSVSPGLMGAVVQNLTIPFRARKHKEKAVSYWRLLGWLYICAYVLVMPTLVSAMTGYQTTGNIWFHPDLTGSDSLASTNSLAPNPALKIRDGSRIGLSDDEAVSLNVTWSTTSVNDYYNSILGYYFAIENALYNATWHLTVSEMTDPDLQGEGPYSTGIPNPAWAYCTVSQYGNFCAPENQYGQYYTPPPADAPSYLDPNWTWSNITLNNKTHVLQPPPLDIVWAAPAETWSLILADSSVYGGYFTNASIAQTAVCQPSAQYQWGFSAVLLCLFCCMTVAFAATLLALEAAVWLHSRSSLYQQRRSSYQDAVHVVQALKEEFGEHVVEDTPEDIERRVKSHTGAMSVETEGLGLSRRQSGLPSHRLFGRRWRTREQTHPEIPLLEPSTTKASSATTNWG
ncbi:hypothetical protein LTR36_000616 [Oleoguttula mirabilis]|uniref:Uncharacterized protein n=1 Tax=Oleoguttula mirabilis TaxID=1507867 RepID=A0AAV9JQM2_9PEZI|nr:hypothetical protein LTR36_000616 [Oleoguttula mirabilis]